MPVRGCHLSRLGWRRKGSICGSGGDGGGTGDCHRLQRRGGGCGGGGSGLSDSVLSLFPEAL